jgi:hypothetical protein
MQEMADPALSLDRARETWQKHGRSEKWIQQRMTGGKPVVTGENFKGWRGRDRSGWRDDLLGDPRVILLLGDVPI